MTYRESVKERFFRWNRKNPGLSVAWPLLFAVMTIPFTEWLHNIERERNRQESIGVSDTYKFLHQSRQRIARVAEAELQGDWISAEKLLADIKPENWTETRLLVRAMLGTGDYQRALDLLMKDFHSHPNGAWEHFVVAIALKNTGQHELALEHFSRGVQLDTKDVVRGKEVGRLRAEAAALLMMENAASEN